MINRGHMAISIKGRESRPVTVLVDAKDIARSFRESDEISTKDAIRALKNKLRTALDLPSGAFIQDDKWYHNVEYYTSHYYDIDEPIREVTTTEKFIWASIQAIEKEVIDLKL